MNDLQCMPNYYAIIPSDVRYDNRLKANEKLLFAEITSLTNKKGYCYASNDYFSALYEVSKGAISKWISGLEKLGYLNRTIIKDAKGQIIERRLYINGSINLGGMVQKDDRGMVQKDQYIIKDIKYIYSLFKKWNSMDKVIKHKKLNKDMERYCAKALQVYSEDEIIQAMDRLNTAVGDKDYFYSYKWSFYNFFKQKNGLLSWTDEGQQYNNYLEFKSASSNFKDFDIKKDNDFKHRREL
jgi:hypothetical protein